MSTLSPSGLFSVVGVANPEALVQANFEKINSDLYSAGPSIGAVIGPPTGGAHVLNEKWTDVLFAPWVCIGAGSPGAWLQLSPANVAGLPASGVPVGYVVSLSSGGGQRLVWSGSAWVIQGVQPLVGGFASSYGVSASGAAVWHSVSIAGATIGDPVVVGVPSSQSDSIVWFGWVAAPNLVYVRATNVGASSVNVGPCTLRVVVFRF